MTFSSDDDGHNDGEMTFLETMEATAGGDGDIIPPPPGPGPIIGGGGPGSLPLEALPEQWENDGDFWGPPTPEGFTVVSYSFPQSLPDSWADSIGPLFSPTFEAFDAAAQETAALALQQWSEVSNLRFIEFGGDFGLIRFFAQKFGSGGEVDGQPVINDDSNGLAFVSVRPDLDFSNDRAGDVRFNTFRDATADLLSGNGAAVGSQAFETLMHEIGHALNFDHPGDYDVGSEGGYQANAEYAEDSHQYTVMSYWSETETGADFDGNKQDTLMLHDIWVVQEVYGVNTTTRVDDTRYGYNTSLSNHPIYDFTENKDPVMAIWDAGGNDWLDLSNQAVGAVDVDLRPGTFSSTHGMTNNIAMAHSRPGVENLIENVETSAFDDTVSGNSADNRIITGSGDDLVVGLGGNDTVTGANGNDFLDGGSGNDALRGGNDSDTLRGGLGNDIINGGADDDLVDYSQTDAAWQIRLASLLDEPDPPAGSGTLGEARLGAQIDLLDQIEDVQGGQGNEFIEGSSRSNELNGGAGNDTLRGLAGNDDLDGQAGNDTLNGGGGNDTVLDFEGFNLLRGGAGNDTVLAGGEDATLEGGSGHDCLAGSFGNDLIDPGSGNDDVAAFSGSDTVLGGAGNDNMSGGGGGGTDVLSYLGVGGPVHLDLDRGANEQQNTVSAGLDRVAGFETLIGSTNADQLGASAGGNSIDASGGNDIIFGRAGNDILQGGQGADIIHDAGGNDVIDGGVGVDTVSYLFAEDSVNVDLNIETFNRGPGGGVDTYISIEHAQGSRFGDFLAGSTSGLGNELRGLGGDDLIFGRTGLDTLLGGLGDDLLEGGPNSDTLDGGSGNDTASWFLSSFGVVVDLAIAGPQAIGNGDFEQLTNIERLLGSTHDDSLFGDDASNTINAASGADAVRARGGDDLVLGAADGDADFYDGGNDIDTISYAILSSDILVDFSGAQQTASNGEIGADTLREFENITTGSGDDTLIGDAGTNRLEGGAGSDSVEGGFGADVIVATADGVGDHYDGGGGNSRDTISFEGVAGDITVELGRPNSSASGGGLGNDTLEGFENVIGGQGDDSLTGDGRDNSLAGGAGDDTLDGAAGADSLDGQAGNDSLVGGTGDDHLSDLAGNNTLDGGAGDDLLETGDGNDALSGGEDDDTALAGGGNDRIDLGDGRDSANGGAGNDTISGDSGQDTLAGGAGSDSFGFAAGFGRDVILDFTPGTDLLDFSQHDGVASLADLSIRNFQGEAQVRDPMGGRVLLQGVEASDLDGASFMF